MTERTKVLDVVPEMRVRALSQTGNVSEADEIVAAALETALSQVERRQGDVRTWLLGILQLTLEERKVPYLARST